MLCEKCKKKVATVFYNENINGKTRSFSLCGECAEKLKETGELQDVASMIGNFADPFSELHDSLFGGFFGFPKLPGLINAKSEEKKCPTCGSTYSDIAKTGKVGCPDCYNTFGNELSQLIQSVHGTTTHNGSAPARHREKKERNEKLKTLRKELQQAIELEEYEHAAELRDQIRAIEKEYNGKDGN